MGWFLSGKSKAGKTKARKRSRQGTSPKWDPQRTMLGIKVVAGLIVAVAVVLGWGWLKSELSSYASRRHAAPVEADQVTLVDQPAWMSPMVVQRIKSRAAKWITPDPLDERGMRIAAQALARDPWVAKVDQVRRTQAGAVAVTAAYRQPVAVVQARDGYHLVDARGVRLPGGPYFADQARRLDLPMVRGVSQAPPRAGEVWPGDAVKAGVALAVTLASEPYARQIRAVDVSRRDARGRLRLVLDTGAGRVVWGLPIGQAGALEEPAAEKIDRLRGLYATGANLDDGGQVVSIYGPRVQSQPIPDADLRPASRRWGQ